MKYATIIKKIWDSSRELNVVSDAELRRQSLALKHSAMCGMPLKKLMTHGFPLVVEAVRRRLDLVFHDVQLQCAIDMTKGRIAEMKTGEGKTVTASLVGYLLSLYGKGVHVATFNDYLAERDCNLNRPLFDLLGQRVSFLRDGMSENERAAAYQCDVTYGSAKEFGFDFLRDRLKSMNGGNVSPVMRGTRYAIVDEADSILIDEARTPLIIGMQDRDESQIVADCFRWAAEHCSQFADGVHFEKRAKQQSFEINQEGKRLIRALPHNNSTNMVPIHELVGYVEKALKVQHYFELDKNYVVRDGEIVIIDEYTGRPAEGRQWQDGIQQSVQAKEDVEIAPETRQAACITIQSYFKRYKMFCGMTGTAWTSKKEIASVYRKKVTRIPTHRPVQRTEYKPRVFENQKEKLAAITESVALEIQKGRAVLVGTRSVARSQELARYFYEASLLFDVLNAKQLEREGDIIANAAQGPRITIATNMAGRGTDIKLSDDVRQAGGLHVILTEIHESQRIDWQLIGRGARQGDPGSFQIFVSLSDEILSTGFGEQKARQLKQRFAGTPQARLQRLFPMFRRAQQKAEKIQLTDRMIVLRQDEEVQRSAFEMGQDPFLSRISAH